MKKVFSIILCLGVGGCSLHPAPTPVPPAPPLHTLVFHVHGTSGKLASATGVLATDLHGAIICGNTDGALICPLTIESGGATMRINAPGYLETSTRLVLPTVNTTADQTTLKPAIAALQRLRVDGKRMARSDGSTFLWQGITAFQLADDIADGREAKAIALMDWAAANNVTILRVLTMAQSMFQLTPEQGRTVLPRLLDLAAERGLYVEVVALADTKYHPTIDFNVHVAEIGRICTIKVNCVVELANEPNHVTQLGQVKNPDFLMGLRRLIPPFVMVALGASYGPNDESDTYFGGDYVTVHPSRLSGDGGWRWTRHAREIQAQRDGKHRKFVVADEPDRRAPFADQHLAFGLLMRIYGIGDTVHLAGLRFDDVPVGDELTAFNARRLAWTTIPDDWSGGRYTAAHLGDSPVKVAESEVLRAYSSVRPGKTLTVLIKVTSDKSTQWRGPHTPITKLGLTELYSSP